VVKTLVILRRYFLYDRSLLSELSHLYPIKKGRGWYLQDTFLHRHKIVRIIKELLHPLLTHLHRWIPKVGQFNGPYEELVSRLTIISKAIPLGGRKVSKGLRTAVPGVLNAFFFAASKGFFED
jgi:hypothetical protein